MAFSAASELTSTKEQDRLERILAAYQDVIIDEDEDDTGDTEASSFLNSSASTADSASENSANNDSLDDRFGNRNFLEALRCTNIPWNPIKFATFYFLTGLAPSMLLPYLSVYYRQLGLDSHEIGLVKSLQPWIAIPAIPLWGCLADRLRLTRVLLMFSLIGYLISNVVLAFTPRIEQVDCQTAITRICNDPKSTVIYTTDSQEERVPTYLETSTSIGLEESSADKLSYNQFTSNISKACQPNGHYIGYFYDKRDLSTLLAYLIVINIIGEMWQAPSPALGNAAVLNGLGKAKRNQYGYYKAAGGVGAALGVFISGLAVDSSEEFYVQCGVELSRANYSVCFIGFSVSIILVLPVAWILGGSEKVRDKSGKLRKYHFQSVILALFNVRYGSVFLAVTWLSIAFGVAKTFDYWYIEILGGSHSTMAWTGMLGTLVLIATFLGLPYLNDRFGHLPFIIFALFVTGIGCGVSAFIQSPWWMTLPMCLRGIATATSAQSAGAYLANAVDRNHMVTLQTIMAAIIFGVGNGAGSLLGGILIKAWSPFICYSVFAVTSFLFSALLIVAHLSTMRRDQKVTE